MIRSVLIYFGVLSPPPNLPLIHNACLNFPLLSSHIQRWITWVTNTNYVISCSSSTRFHWIWHLTGFYTAHTMVRGSVKGVVQNLFLRVLRNVKSTKTGPRMSYAAKSHWTHDSQVLTRIWEWQPAGHMPRSGPYVDFTNSGSFFLLPWHFCSLSDHSLTVAGVITRWRSASRPTLNLDGQSICPAPRPKRVRHGWPYKR